MLTDYQFEGGQNSDCLTDVGVKIPALRSTQLKPQTHPSGPPASRQPSPLARAAPSAAVQQSWSREAAASSILPHLEKSWQSVAMPGECREDEMSAGRRWGLFSNNIAPAQATLARTVNALMLSQHSYDFLCSEDLPMKVTVANHTHFALTYTSQAFQGPRHLQLLLLHFLSGSWTQLLMNTLSGTRNFTTTVRKFSVRLQKMCQRCLLG